MITRIVKMGFKQEYLKNFEAVFQKNKNSILAFKGCHHVALYKDTQQSNVYFTYSHWDNESVLNEYRHSVFFQETWKNIKPMFNQKPEAWSLKNTTT